MSTSTTHRKPRDEVEQVVLYNTKDAFGEWVPQSFRKGDWVYMQPAATGPHRVRDRGNLDQHWKGRLLAFKDHRTNGRVAVVQHVYSMPSMHLRQINRRAFPSHYIFPSNLVEEQPLRSLSGTFKALHSDIGSMMLPGVPPSTLLQQKIFFYSHTYVVPTSEHGYGKIIKTDMPSLLSVEWPEPDAWSISSMKEKMVSDVVSSLKFGKASRSVGLSWCCPVHVFVHLFKAVPFNVAPSMFVCKNVSFDALQTVLGENWGFVEGVHQGDRYRCKVGVSGISIRYLKSRTTLYLRFHYERWMCKIGKWIPLQSPEDNLVTFDIHVTLSNDISEIVQVSDHWTLSNVREHLMVMGHEGIQDAYFCLNLRKIGRRMEATMRVQEEWKLAGSLSLA